MSCARLPGLLGRAPEPDALVALPDALAAMDKLLASHGSTPGSSDSGAPDSSRRDSFWR